MCENIILLHITFKKFNLKPLLCYEYIFLSMFQIYFRFEEAIPAIEKLNEEIKMLEDVVLKMKHRQGITFCHNDLLIANFIYDEYQSR